MQTKDIRAFRETLRKLERELDSQLKVGMNCCGVSLVQCHTLLELASQKKTSLKELAEALELDKSTVSRSIDLMVKQGLVKREIDDNNRRFVQLSLTRKGKETGKQINQFCDDYYLQLFGHIPEDKQNQVIEGLFLFANALAKVKEAGFSACEKDSGICITTGMGNNNEEEK